MYPTTSTASSFPCLPLAIFSLSCGELIERPKDASPILSFTATPAPILSVGTWYYEIKVTSEGKEKKEMGELHVGLQDTRNVRNKNL